MNCRGLIRLKDFGKIRCYAAQPPDTTVRFNDLADVLVVLPLPEFYLFVDAPVILSRRGIVGLSLSPSGAASKRSS